MILLNDTDFEATLFRTVLSEQTMVGTVVCKRTYAMGEDGQLRPAATRHGVTAKPWTIGEVEFPSDAGYGKLGVDLLVVGNAYAPGGRPLQAMMAGISVDDAYMGVAIFGDRRWVRRWSGFQTSDPEPFAKIALTWSHAFGGVAQNQGGAMPHADNPLGKGYVPNPADAEGVELPNIEDPAALIRTPRDQPKPVCLCPLPLGTSYSADLLDHVEAGGTGEGLTTEIYNIAIPAHRLPRYTPGACLRLHNLASVPIPAQHLPSTQLVAQVDIGSARYEFLGEVDTITVLPEERELILTHRVVFRYAYARRLPRVVRLRTSQTQVALARTGT